MAAQSLVKNQPRPLVRGTVVKVGDTVSDESLHGAKMVVKSTGVVKCFGGNRCAGDHCIGLAVFVTTPEAYAKWAEEDGKTAGWRDDATKFCLTHLNYEDGTSICSPEQAPGLAKLLKQKRTKSTKPEKAPAKKNSKTRRPRKQGKKSTVVAEKPTRRRGRPPKAKEPEPVVETKEPLTTDVVPVGFNGNVVTWEMLSQAHAAGDAETMARLARRLKTENEYLIRYIVRLKLADENL